MKKMLFFLLLVLMALGVAIIASIREDLADRFHQDSGDGKDNEGRTSEKEKFTAKRSNQDELQKIIRRGQEASEREVKRNQNREISNHERQFWAEPRKFFFRQQTEESYIKAVAKVAGEFKESLLRHEFYCRGVRCRLAARFRDENTMRLFETEIRKLEIIKCTKESVIVPHYDPNNKIFDLRMYFNCENKT